VEFVEPTRRILNGALKMHEIGGLNPERLVQARHLERARSDLGVAGGKFGVTGGEIGVRRLEPPCLGDKRALHAIQSAP
jgi:hypothetical protein